MHGGQMANEVEKAILAGSDLFLKLLVGEHIEMLLEPADYELP
jgi:hypothetical protein